MMFPNPHNIHTAMSMLSSRGRGEEARQMVREPGKRGDTGVIFIIVVAFFVGLATPLAGKFFGI